MTTDAFIAAIERATGRQGRRVGRETRLLCPAHDDHDPSLDVREGDDGRPLVVCRSRGCTFEAICAAIGHTTHDFNAGDHGDEVAATYDYTDETGRLSFQVVRFVGKRFRQRQPDASADDGWRWNLEGVRRVLYRLPAVLAAAGRTVFVVEGEKAADALARIGLIATCSPGGAGKWRGQYAPSLTAAARVVVLPDDDDVGRAHAATIVQSLRAHNVADVRVVELFPIGDTKRDVVDWLAERPDADLARKELKQLIQAARPAEFDSSDGSSSPDESNPRLPVITIGELRTVAPEEPAWLWDGYLAPQTMVLFAGRPKVGKSTMLYALLAALAEGAPFLGRSTRQTLPLLLTEERPDTVLEKSRRFQLPDAIPLVMRHEVRRQRWPEVLAQALEHAIAVNAGLIVVDTLDKWMGLRGDAENSAGAVLEALEPLYAALGAGIGVVLVTHQRKGSGQHGDAVRGSNALTGAVDVILELERPRDEGLVDGSRFLLGTSRFAATPERELAILSETGFDAADPDEIASEALRTAILAAIPPEGHATIEEIADAVGRPKATVAEHLRNLHEYGRVGREGRGVKGDAFQWTRVDGDEGLLSTVEAA